ncbi:hypothetical protein [Bradyrhizobium sp. SZCCHNPS1003]|uniref:hypothetical protein n=1 Tax=Bradyrhizobium sp. SZCCHNPS1003 TaxID=3057330 RepID=UPI0028E8A416|nr:hypothetical protein [Bradyrhizobium sp. SZCCHNPS1003]
MERMLYLVAPTNDQCQWDENGPIIRDLFVWAADASEAVKLWREFNDMDGHTVLGLSEKIRVFEVPIMPAGASSAAVGWSDVHSFGATISERSEL